MLYRMESHLATHHHSQIRSHLLDAREQSLDALPSRACSAAPCPSALTARLPVSGSSSDLSRTPGVSCPQEREEGRHRDGESCFHLNRFWEEAAGVAGGLFQDCFPAGPPPSDSCAATHLQ